MKTLKKLTYTILGIALISLFATSNSFAERPYTNTHDSLGGACFFDATIPASVDDYHIKGN